MALDSDCFSNATASTRRCTPASDQAGRDDPGRPADRARRVHPQQRLADRAERVGQVQLGHHHALEQVGRLAQHDRVDVGQGESGVGQRPVHRLAAQPGDGHVGPPGPVPGLADAEHRGLLLHGSCSPLASITQTRFCCRAGPLVAWPSARSAWPADDLPGGQADPGQAGREHRVAAQRAAGRVDPDAVAEAERGAQHDLLVGERRVQLGHVDGWPGAGRLAGGGRRRRRGQVARAQRRRCRSGARNR